jgi:hypothetical protein
VNRIPTYYQLASALRKRKIAESNVLTTTKNGPTQPHHRPPPKAPNTTLEQHSSDRLHCCGSLCTLTARFNRVKRLCRQRRYDTRHCSIRKVHVCALDYPSSFFGVLNDIITPHAETGRACLLEGRTY